jgi:hypothetical protein
MLPENAADLGFQKVLNVMALLADEALAQGLVR